MPCRCWEEDGLDRENNQKLRKKLDELAVRECRLSMLVCELVQLLGFDNLTAEQQQQYQDMMLLHEQHRKCDKKDALNSIRHKIEKLQRDIKQIKKLGGSPGKLPQELKTLKDFRQKVKDSDPMNTNLY